MDARERAIDEAADAVRRCWSTRPRVGLILGTGLGGFARDIESAAAIDYRQIPHFACSTALSHAGRLVCGRLAGVPIIAQEGRVHVYEGYGHDQITLPVSVFARLGVETLIVTNASGGLNPRLASGDILVVTGHIDFMGRRAHPRVSAGSRGVADLYDASLAAAALSAARREQIPAAEGVYAAMSGPNYETRAEYRFLRRMGADVVGMSTLPEVREAGVRGLRTLVLSVVTNVARPDVAVHTTAEDVVAAAESAARRLGRLIWSITAGAAESQ
ncbi:MAG: purine-nucleoside phosphorylase [Pirellulales bacterium]